MGLRAGADNPGRHADHRCVRLGVIGGGSTPENRICDYSRGSLSAGRRNSKTHLTVIESALAWHESRAFHGTGPADLVGGAEGVGRLVDARTLHAELVGRGDFAQSVCRAIRIK